MTKDERIKEDRAALYVFAAYIAHISLAMEASETLEQPDRCEPGCSGDVGNRCAICDRVIPEPPDGLGDDAWSGGFAKNH